MTRTFHRGDRLIIVTLPAPQDCEGPFTSSAWAYGDRWRDLAVVEAFDGASAAGLGMVFEHRGPNVGAPARVDVDDADDEHYARMVSP